jgi:glycosyltransferase involved in cell wall biosynthesis
MGDKKKVLLTVNNNRLSGIENFVLLLCEHLDREKYEVTVGVPSDGSFPALLRERNISCFDFGNGRNGSFTLKGIFNIFRHLLKVKYDIVHAQAGIPPCVIATFIGTKLRIEHKHGLDFTNEQIRNMNSVKVAYEKMKKFFVDYTVTVCRNDKNVLLEKFNFKPEKVSVVYNGIEDIQPVIRKEKGNMIIVGTIGRLTFQKAQEYFIEAASKICKVRDDVEFHIYGEGELESEYRRLIMQYELGSKVILKGYANNAADVLGNFDIFLLTSRYEGIPYVLLEAMRGKVPIIATNVGGVSEIIEDQVNGLLTEKENVEEIVNRLLLLIGNEELRMNLADKGRNDFLERFTIDKTVEQIQFLYDRSDHKNR